MCDEMRIAWMRELLASKNVHFSDDELGNFLDQDSTKECFYAMSLACRKIIGGISSGKISDDVQIPTEAIKVLTKMADDYENMHKSHTA